MPQFIISAFGIWRLHDLRANAIRVDPNLGRAKAMATDGDTISEPLAGFMVIDQGRDLIAAGEIDGWNQLWIKPSDQLSRIQEPAASKFETAGLCKACHKAC